MRNYLCYFAITLLLSLCGCFSLSSVTNGANNKYGITQEQYENIKRDTAPGGKLDFTNNFPNNKLVLIDGVAYNKDDAALYTWAAAMKKIGMKKIEDIISLYEEMRSIKLRDTQKKAMQNGFVR